MHNNFLPYTLKFIPEILCYPRSHNLDDLINEEIEKEIQLAQRYHYPFQTQPRFHYLALLDRQGLIRKNTFRSILVHKGIYQEEEFDYSNVNLNVHLEGSSIVGGSDAEEGEALKEVKIRKVNPHIEMLPNRSAMLVSNWRCNSIFKVGLNGEFKKVLRFKEKIDTFCIISNSQHVSQLAVLCTHHNKDATKVLKLIKCNDGGEVDLASCIDCYPNLRASPRKEVTKLHQFSKKRLIYHSAKKILIIDYSKEKNLILRSADSPGTSQNIVCIITDEKLLGEDNLLLGVMGSLFICKIKVKKRGDNTYRIDTLYEHNLFSYIPMSILPLNLYSDDNLILVMTSDIDDPKELGFSLFQIMGDKNTLQVCIEHAKDYALVSGNDVSNNWDALLHPNLVFYDDRVNEIVAINPSTGQIISSRFYKQGSEQH